MNTQTLKPTQTQAGKKSPPTPSPSVLNLPPDEIVSRILKKKGQLCRIKYARPLKIKKESQTEYSGRKITDGVFRIGVDYNNTKAVQDKRASGELPAENQGLKGRSWVVFPCLLKGLNDKLLVRIYTVRNAYRRTHYEINGSEVDFDTLQGLSVCLASEFTINSDLVSFDLDIENILEMT
jgi:hypothetical protein